MYPSYIRKKPYNESRTVLIEDCFAEKAKNWLWILGIIIVLVVVFSAVKFSGQVNSYSEDSRAGRNINSVKSVAFTSCPYCGGALDPRGKCNIPECPFYNPDWGIDGNQEQPSGGQRLPNRPWCLNR
ncbi:MAG: hypothetical protein OEW43_04900 [Elusimicrobiota bacterium]|nr:hypothetical protein [Elusimicrobiota bacterium]MDH5662326.1 hypothetical protein [Elusimicrobiota bacterium]